MTTRPAVIALALLATLAMPGLPLRAQQAADLVPADAGLYIQVDDLSAWQGVLSRDPLAMAFWHLMPRFREMQGDWAGIQIMMRLTGEEIVGRYFGRSFAIIGPDPGPNQPVMLLSWIGPGEADKLVAMLRLVPQAPIGSYKCYCTGDNMTQFAFGGGWMAMAPAASAEYMERVLSLPAHSAHLADDATFKQWVGKLPAKPAVLAYRARPARGQVDAVAMIHRDDGYRLEYAGRSPAFAGLIRCLGQSDGLTFAPLPRDTVAAATLNLHGLDAAQTALMDRLLAPRTFKDDLLPKLDAPLVLCVGPPSPERDQSGDRRIVPSLALAIKLRDPSAAKDLDLLVTRLALMTNLAVLGPGAPALGLHRRSYGSTDYLAAPVGQALAENLGSPGLAGDSLAFGRAGDWYVVATREIFFQSILDAGHGPRFDAGSMPLVKLDRPALSLAIRPEAVSQVLGAWVIRWRPPEPMAVSPDAMSPNMFRVREAAILSRALMHYKAITFQLQAAGADELRGVVEIKNGDMSFNEFGE